MKTRFTSLDGIRGLFAIAVMFFHYSSLIGLNWFPQAWMAVDVFFIMSGFVLMHSYAQRIVDGQLNFLGFVKLRLIRLMPLYLVGLLLGFLSMTYSCSLPGETCAANVLHAGFYGIFVLPYFATTMWQFGIHAATCPFSLNPPAWSLFFELFVNLVFFYWIACTKARHLLVVIGLAFIGLIAAYHFLGSVNDGWGNSNFLGGFPRVIYHFFIGVLIHKHYQKYGFNSKRIAFISVALLLAIFSVYSTLVSMLTLFILGPFVVLANAKITFNGYVERVCSWLGDISYPLYIVHWPVFQLLYLFGNLERLSPSVRVIIMALITIIIAWLLSIADRIFRTNLIGKPIKILDLTS